jgi:hypothetical protein
MGWSTRFESRCRNFMLCPLQSLNTYIVTESSPPRGVQFQASRNTLGTVGLFGLLDYIVTTLNSESKWERTRDGPGQPI